MPESEIFIFQPEQQPAHTYMLDADGLTYRAPGHAPVAARWDAIGYLKDVPGHKVDMVLTDPATALPLFYATRHFSRLLGTVCDRLTDRHRAKIGVRTFSGRRDYLFHIGIVVSFFILLIGFSTVYLRHFTAAWLFILATTIPMTAYLLLQPHTVTPEDDHLEVRDFIHTRIIAYRRLRRLAFDLHGDKQTAYLCVKIHLTDGRKIKIQRFANLVLLYIFIKTKWEAACERSDG